MDGGGYNSLCTFDHVPSMASNTSLTHSHRCSG